MKKVLSISDYFFFNRMDFILFLEQTVKYSPIPSYFNSLYSIWNKSRRKAFHDPRRAPWKRELFLEFTFFLFIFYSFFESQPKLIRSYFNYPFLLSSFRKVPCLLFCLVKKVRLNPTNKIRIDYESWFFKECIPFLS